MILRVGSMSIRYSLAWCCSMSLTHRNGHAGQESTVQPWPWGTRTLATVMTLHEIFQVSWPQGPPTVSGQHQRHARPQDQWLSRRLQGLRKYFFLFDKGSSKGRVLPSIQAACVEFLSDMPHFKRLTFKYLLYAIKAVIPHLTAGKLPSEGIKSRGNKVQS